MMISYIWSDQFSSIPFSPSHFEFDKLDLESGFKTTGIVIPIHIPIPGGNQIIRHKSIQSVYAHYDDYFIPDEYGSS